MDFLRQLIADDQRPNPARYLATIAVMLLFGCAAWALRNQTGSPGLFVLMPGTFLSAFLFGRGCGIFATIISFGIATYNLEYLQGNSSSSAPIAIFVIFSFLMALAAEALRSAMSKATKAERTKTILLTELAHRTKNNLAMISAMMRLQAKKPGVDAAVVLDEMAARIQVMAAVYDHLTIRSDTKLVDAKEYLTEIVRHLSASISGSSPVAITSDADELYIHSELAVPIAIILNELVTNSLKYGFPNGRAGHVRVELRVGSQIALSVHDNGIGLAENKAEGIGSRVISLLTQQLGGVLTYDNSEGGCRAELRMPKPAEEKRILV